LAEVTAAIEVDAPASRVLALISDLGIRDRILPDGWRLLRVLGDQRGGVGAAMEIEAAIGPAPSLQVVQIQTLVDSHGRHQVIESPPTADNYITTWTVRERDAGVVVFLHTEFEYGGLIAEFFAKRRLRTAYAQMLARLKALAERRES
jgi:hypothetical protein